MGQIRDATAAAFERLTAEEKAELIRQGGMLVEQLKAMCPSVQISMAGALEIIGAAYAWKSAGGEKVISRNTHLSDLARGEKHGTP